MAGLERPGGAVFFVSRLKKKKKKGEVGRREGAEERGNRLGGSFFFFFIFEKKLCPLVVVFNRSNPSEIRDPVMSHPWSELESERARGRTRFSASKRFTRRRRRRFWRPSPIISFLSPRRRECCCCCCSHSPPLALSLPATPRRGSAGWGDRPELGLRGRLPRPLRGSKARHEKPCFVGFSRAGSRSEGVRGEGEKGGQSFFFLPTSQVSSDTTLSFPLSLSPAVPPPSLPPLRHHARRRPRALPQERSSPLLCSPPRLGRRPARRQAHQGRGLPRPLQRGDRQGRRRVQARAVRHAHRAEDPTGS